MPQKLFKDPQGNEHRATGRYFVLAANGIEIPKLVLIFTDAGTRMDWGTAPAWSVRQLSRDASSILLFTQTAITTCY